MNPATRQERAYEWAQLPYALLADKSLSPRDKVLVGALLFHAGRTAECLSSDTSLARFLNVGESTVQRALQNLEKHGYIARESRPVRQGNLTGRAIILSWRVDPSCLPAPPSRYCDEEPPRCSTSAPNSAIPIPRKTGGAFPQECDDGSPKNGGQRRIWREEERKIQDKTNSRASSVESIPAKAIQDPPTASPCPAIPRPDGAYEIFPGEHRPTSEDVAKAFALCWELFPDTRIAFEYYERQRWHSPIAWLSALRHAAKAKPGLERIAYIEKIAANNPQGITPERSRATPGASFGAPAPKRSEILITDADRRRYGPRSEFLVSPPDPKPAEAKADRPTESGSIRPAGDAVTAALKGVVSCK